MSESALAEFEQAVPPKPPASCSTEKQRNFIKKLSAERVMDPAVRERLNERLAAGMDVKTASATIDWLLRQPRPRVEQVDVEPGVYVLADGAIAKVKENKARSRKYAEVWTDFSGTRLTLAGEHVKAHWQYAPGLIKDVRPEHRMSLEQAREFITVYGRCARCGRKLKAAESVERGIGPVCEKWFSF